MKEGLAPSFYFRLAKEKQMWPYTEEELVIINGK